MNGSHTVQSQPWELLTFLLPFSLENFPSKLLFHVSLHISLIMDLLFKDEYVLITKYLTCKWRFSSVVFSRSVTSDSLWPHESQHARPPCPSPTPGVHPNSCPSNRWCHPAISSSVVPFSSCPQSLPASGSFPMRQLFAWGGQSI